MSSFLTQQFRSISSTEQQENNTLLHTELSKSSFGAASAIFVFNVTPLAPPDAEPCIYQYYARTCMDATFELPLLMQNTPWNNQEKTFHAHAWGKYVIYINHFPTNGEKGMGLVIVLSEFSDPFSHTPKGTNFSIGFQLQERIFSIGILSELYLQLPPWFTNPLDLIVHVKTRSRSFWNHPPPLSAV